MPWRLRTLAVINRFEYLEIQDDEAPQLIQFEIHPETVSRGDFHRSLLIRG
jgi:hypothetical protein